MPPCHVLRLGKLVALVSWSTAFLILVILPASGIQYWAVETAFTSGFMAPRPDMRWDSCRFFGHITRKFR